jgi:ArsR family transcriptional regulator, arsenate/arsenite/antimonite-responsive transcriptional repressor
MDNPNALACEAELRDLKGMLKALGDIARLEIMAMLARSGEGTVTDLGQMLAVNGHLISQPLVSWHISVLRRWGFVHTRRVGRLVYCSLDRTRYDSCLRLLADLVETPEEAQQPVQAPASDSSTDMLGTPR